MFNVRPAIGSYGHHSSGTTKEPSYILSVKWADFISNTDYYIRKAMAIRDNRKSYDLVKEIK